ncbi:hypothetical protein JWS91_002076 [Enterococcus faecalis]|uniref:hypothetical protein n=1 Tax=Enterococcus faecalis TaxID=1351 RepID=UPI0019E587F2|nr:hypothetical protein [Enterococcus faecalis]EGO7769166.1 hypothetical protein [Enterococcus faecalis]EHB6498751.1 hypothetical protein [Enterococcus faecalis]MDN3074159.1 hypothetical protein [Enterococcus faecalis]
MNLYEEYLYELYEECFNSKIIEGKNNMGKGERKLIFAMLISLIVLVVSFLGLLLKQRIFIWGFSGSLFTFIASFIAVELHGKSLRADKKRTMKRREKQIKAFNESLIKYGLCDDQKIIRILDSLRLNYLNRCKIKERRHDVVFKYVVTFLLSVIVFLLKEKWERVKLGMSEKDFDILFQSTILLLFYIVVSLIYLFITVFRNTFGATKEEKLIKVLEEVLVYRMGIRVL